MKVAASVFFFQNIKSLPHNFGFFSLILDYSLPIPGYSPILEFPSSITVLLQLLILFLPILYYPFTDSFFFLTNSMFLLLLEQQDSTSILTNTQQHFKNEKKKKNHCNVRKHPETLQTALIVARN
jgi:hypothetical protein